MTYEYRVLGKPVRLEPDPTVVAVRFNEPAPNSTRAHATAAAGVGPFATRFEIPGEKLTIVPVGTAGRGPGPATAMAGPADAIKALNRQPEVRNALPVFRTGGNRVVAPDRVIVGLRDPATKDAVLARHSLTPIREREDEVLAQVAEKADVFEVCARLDADGEVAFAEPDFVIIGRHLPKRIEGFQPILNDPLVAGQYAMDVTRAREAWALQTGDPAVRIAVLDEGVDTTHPDLAAAVRGTYDAIDGDSYQEPNAWDGHGTSCAGLAAAVPNNALGIRGSGGGCSVLAVRMAYSQFRGGDWVTSVDAIASAIDWSWRDGRADVLSNSWGGGTPSNTIANAFERARTRGRGGLGCVVVIAAGNSFSAVQFPADLPNMLAVSASNEFDEIKTPTSRDGETWWGTCFGPEIAVAAPGVHNLTTDIKGSDGYAVGDYTPTFNGTSSATPIVAGACGLVLSANPGLTEAQVREVICSTADKVGPYRYQGGRNDYFGFGRLNVLAAVEAVTQVASADGSGDTARAA